MPRIRCLKCDKFFNSLNKKTNRICPQCKSINNHYDASVNLSYVNKDGRHKHTKTS
jgi:phage FluMu protein Com